ncbi:MAG: hypothetical protein ACPGO5_01400 [Patescibacteria group bacterium]
MAKIDLQNIKNELLTVQNKINQIVGDIDVELGLKPADVSTKARTEGIALETDDERIIEGVFDGQAMIGPEGKKYPVPANYASKSKLVEGDMLKLTIRGDGSFLFKQIGPVERERQVGVLAYDDGERQFFGVVQGKSYKLLTASVTYYKGEVGDEVIMLVPQEASSDWAAVENVVKQLAVNESAQKSIPHEDVSEADSDTPSEPSESEPAPLLADDMVDKKEDGQPLFDETDDEFKVL